MKKYIPLILIFVFLAFSATAQDDLENLFGEEETTDYAYATFKSARIILGQSVEQPANGNLLFDIQHQFGTINGGYSEFFGMDQAVTRLGFTYGITDWLMVGIGRTAFQKMVDGSIKIKMLRQSTGKKNMPFSLSYYGDIGVNGLDYTSRNIAYYFSHRLTYVNQILIARKFSNAVSIQLTPTHIHRNLVEKYTDNNDVFALGAAGRFKISNRMSINLEYFYLLSKQTALGNVNALSISLDMETGGHIFQLYFSNSAGTLDQQFIPNTQGSWLKGDIHFGFNISRNFVF